MLAWRVSGSLMKQVARGIFGMPAALPGPEGQVFWEHTAEDRGPPLESKSTWRAVESLISAQQPAPGTGAH